MPSFGLNDDLSSGLAVSSTGTYKMPWSLPDDYHAQVSLIQRPKRRERLTEYGYFDSSQINLHVPTFQNIPLESKKQILQEEIDDIIVKEWSRLLKISTIATNTHETIMKSKLEALQLAFQEIGKEHTSEINESEFGLRRVFQKQHDDYSEKIAKLKATRNEMRRVEEEHSKVSTQPQQTEKPKTPEPSNSSDEGKKPIAIKRYEEILRLADPIIKSAKNVESSTDPLMKKTLLKIRMDINRKIGQIANSRKQVSSVVSGLIHTINDSWRIGGPDVVNYCILTIAYKFIDQAETQVCLHSPSAFPIAQVIVDLGSVQRNLVPVFIHLIMKRCPYAIPHYISKLPNQSEREHKLAMGYLVSDGEQLEGDQTYTERMSGIVCLLGAVMQATPTSNDKNPFGVQNAWIWMASVLNLKPRPITAFMICAFLESAGYEMWRTYGNNFVKLLLFIKNQYLSMLPPGSISAQTRLEIFLNSVFGKNPPIVESPEGRNLLS